MPQVAPLQATPLLIRPVRHGDLRGWFSETYSLARLAKLGVTDAFVQDNQSWSRTAGTVRGLHFQNPPGAQAKLVSCLVGVITDVIVDIRAGSPTFGGSAVVELADDGTQLFVPEGFAHGFITRTDAALVAYKVTRAYDAQADDGIFWDDPALGVAWDAPSSGAVVSEKDAALAPLAGRRTPFVWRGGGLVPVEV